LVSSAALALIVLVFTAYSQDGKEKRLPARRSGAVSFKKDVFPIIQKNCLPCHAEDNFNPSELSMDDYERMQAGGKNGDPWVPKNAGESLIMKKLGENPPFGDRMPLNPKKKIEAGKAKWLTESEIKTIAIWIDEGARDN
jgi:hypothetical protein